MKATRIVTGTHPEGRLVRTEPCNEKNICAILASNGKIDETPAVDQSQMPNTAAATPSFPIDKVLEKA